MIWSLLLGFAIGWVASMPVAGVVSIFVCRRGFAGRYDHGLALAAGAALIEAGWCLAILFGAGELLDYWPQAANVAEILGSLLLVGLGLFFFLRRPVAVCQAESGNNVVKARLRDEFRLGATLVVVNPAIPFNWLALITISISFGLDPDRAPGAFALGVGLGIVAWFSVLLRIIRRWSVGLQVQKLAAAQRTLAILLLCVGCFALWQACS
jgi:threonine/homoserine/homoserine lactone efflux protein